MATTRNRSYRNTDRNASAYRSNLAYDFNALEQEQERVRATPRPQIRTITRPDVSVRPAERVSPFAIFGFAAVGLMLVLVLMSYVQLTALSDSVVTLQKELTTLQTENVTLTTAYERAFDLSTVETAAKSVGMTKPSPSQIYYLDMAAPDSASVYAVESSGIAGKLFSSMGDRLYSVVEYFA